MFKDRFIAGSVRLCVCLGLTFGTTDKVASVIVFVGRVLCLFPFFTLTLTPCLSLVFERFNYLKHFLYHLSRSALFPCCLINVAQLLEYSKKSNHICAVFTCSSSLCSYLLRSEVFKISQKFHSVCSEHRTL